MSAIKALEWREVAGGYAGFIGDRAWTRVDHGWNLAEPYEYRGERYADLNRAKAIAETDHQMLIITTLVDGYGEEAEALANWRTAALRTIAALEPDQDHNQNRNDMIACQAVRLAQAAIDRKAEPAKPTSYRDTPEMMAAAITQQGLYTTPEIAVVGEEGAWIIEERWMRGTIKNGPYITAEERSENMQRIIGELSDIAKAALAIGGNQ